MRRTLLLLVCAIPLFPQAASNAHPELSLEQKEEFLLKAKVIKTRGAKKGITGTVRATLSDGVITHDASIQRIDEQKQRFEGMNGIELNFRDTYMFNIGAYRLGKLLGLGGMIPPSVQRHHEGSGGAWTWWVDDVLMDEGERLKQNTTGPDKDRWGRQVLIMRVFDQLIANTDRNVGNTLYDKGWGLWMIDHTRAFRLGYEPRNPKSMDKCDRQLLLALKTLRLESLKAELGSYVRETELKSLLRRRDAIVKHFERGGEEKLYEFLPQR